MGHDPLCPQSAPPSMTTALCFCDLIARVRDDERGKTLSRYPFNVHQVRAAALSDAIDVVNALDREPLRYEDEMVDYVCLPDAEAAIEALRGES